MYPKIVAYSYTNPLLASPPNSAIWGWEIEQIYQDVGQRQQYYQLLQDCQIDPPQYLLIRRLDELGNTLVEIQKNVSLLESFNIEIIAIEQDYYSSQFKEQDSVKIREKLSQLSQEITDNQYKNRLKEGHAKNRIQFLPPPGKAPYGYRRGQDRYIIDRSTSPIVKAFFDHFLLFGNLRDAVRFIEKKYNKKVSVSTAKKWLTHPVYRGNIGYKNKEIIPDTHLSILSREEAAQIDRLLRRNCQFSPRNASAPRSLAGLVTCQNCQAKMNIIRVRPSSQSTEYLYLRSTDCPLKPKCKAITYQTFLEKTIQKICCELPQEVAKLQLPNITLIKTHLETAIAQKQEMIQTVQSLQEQGILDPETTQLRIYKIKTEIAQLKFQVDQLPPENLIRLTQDVALEEFWLDLSESERRFYFREFIKSIEIIRENQQTFELRLQFVF